MRSKACQVWVHRIKRSVFGGTFLRVAGETPVVLLQGNGGKSCLRALKATGQVMWEIEGRGEVFYMHRLGVRDKGVYVDGGRLRRFDPKTGAVLAERRLEEPFLFFLPGGDHPVAGPSMDRATGFDREDLSTLWEWEDPSRDFSVHRPGVICGRVPNGVRWIETPAMTEHVVRVEGLPKGLHAHFGELWCEFGLRKGGRAACDLRTGEIAWRFDDPPGYGIVVFHDGFAIASGTGLIAYSLQTGEERWRLALEGRERTVSGTPLAVDGRLYFASVEGGEARVHVVDCGSGEMLVQAPVPAKLTGLGFEPSPVLPWGSDRLLVGMRRSILCLEVA